MSLTLKKVDKLLTAGVPGMHFDGAGMYLCVTGRQTGFWSRRFQLRGRQRELSIGPVKAYDLIEAREKNREVSKLLADKVDPIARKRAAHAAEAEAAAKAAAVMTFRQICENYILDHQAAWTHAKHGKQWKQSLRDYVYPVLGALPVGLVDVPAVLKVLEQHVPAVNGRPAGKFWEARHVTADRVRNRVELVLNYATVRGHRSGDNPAAMAKIAHALPAGNKIAVVKSFAAAPYSEVPTIIAELRRREGIAARALEFLILTAGRTDEVLGAKWDEINLAEKVWTIPPERMKAGREHRVPLAPAVIALLEALPREADNAFVFIGVNHPRLSPNALNALLPRMGRSDITVHGFRSSFRDWAAEQTNFPHEIAELALAHTIGDAVVKAYRRGDLLDKRRRLAEAWARYCTAAPVQAKPGKVVPLRKGA
jgi:integrase